MKLTKQLAEDDCIRIAWYDKCTECLGPGKRFALWLQGCDRKCPGCISPETWPQDGGITEKCDDIADIIVSSGMKDITVSGGEPFMQADKLVRIFSRIRKMIPEIGIIIYTGYLYNELKESGDADVLKLLDEYTDILIDGPYISELDDDLGLRGSSNQKVTVLTDRYRSQMSCYEEPSARKSTMKLTEKQLQMTGIPSAAVKNILKISGYVYDNG